jgi:hypothetical protein
MGKAYYVFPNYTVWVPAPTLDGNQPRRIGRGHKAKERTLARFTGLPSVPSTVPVAAPVGSF